jgi:hypothetical protein
MGFWVWFCIWIVIIAFTCYVFLHLGFSLYRKGRGVLAELENIQPKLDALQAAVDSMPKSTEIESNLLDNPVKTMMARLAVIRQRRKRHDAREHMLIERLKRSKPNESRFK